MSAPRLIRLPAWRSRLSACVEGALHRPFEWGRQDCALFAADVVQAMTGVDPAREWRGRYSTRIGAARILRKIIGANGETGLAGKYFPEIAPVLAADGDVAVVDQDGRRVLGVILGPMFGSPGPDGLAFVPSDEVIRAFHVPFDGEAV